MADVCVIGLLREARAVNEGQPVRMLDRMMAEGLAPGGAGGKLAVLGVAYKANIDDPRESPAFGLAREAAARGFDLALHDPLVRPGRYDGFDVGRDLGGCLAGAAAAAVMVDHESCRAVGQGGVPVLPSLALLHADHHPLALEVRHSQPHHLAHAQPRAVGCHQQRAVLRIGSVSNSLELRMSSAPHSLVLRTVTHVP